MFLASGKWSGHKKPLSSLPAKAGQPKGAVLMRMIGHSASGENIFKNFRFGPCISWFMCHTLNQGEGQHGGGRGRRPEGTEATGSADPPEEASPLPAMNPNINPNPRRPSWLLRSTPSHSSITKAILSGLGCSRPSPPLASGGPSAKSSAQIFASGSANLAGWKSTKHQPPHGRGLPEKDDVSQYLD